MNERIKLLALKAYNDAGRGTPEELSLFMEVYSEKFAELIVQECIDSIKVWRDAGWDEDAEKEAYIQGYQSGCDDSIIEIMQRFGVE